MTKTIYYSVRNCGDGSASPIFFESMELAEWDQEHQYEGWGESCTGTIQLESDSEITVSRPDVRTVDETLADLFDDDDDDLDDFINTFYDENPIKVKRLSDGYEYRIGSDVTIVGNDHYMKHKLEEILNG
jgi:hypothetical protein